MTTMTITRALAELKRLDNRIERAQADSTFIGTSIGKGSVMRVSSSPKSVDEFSRDLQSNFDSLLAMYSQRSAIKSAIVMSNAQVKVSVGNKEMTVAEAIELKRSIESKRHLVRTLQSQHVRASAAVETANAKLENQIDAMLSTVYGSEKSKIDATTVDLVANPQRAQKEAALLDPLNVLTKISKFEEEISVVDTELDFTLSESNARTTISVE